MQEPEGNCLETGWWEDGASGGAVFGLPVVNVILYVNAACKQEAESGPCCAMTLLPQTESSDRVKRLAAVTVILVIGVYQLAGRGLELV